MINLDEIRKEVAIRNGVVLGENDPILMMAIMNEIVLRQCIAELNERHEASQKAQLKAMQQGIAESKAASSKILTQGTEYVSDQVHTAVLSAFAESTEEFKKEVRRAWVAIDSSKQTAISAGALSAACATVIVGLFALKLFF